MIWNGSSVSPYDTGMWPWFLPDPYSAALPTAEDQREAHRRLGEWWAWKRYFHRFDRCCHGKKHRI